MSDSLPNGVPGDDSRRIKKDGPPEQSDNRHGERSHYTAIIMEMKKSGNLPTPL